jgi:hypothetical protein
MPVSLFSASTTGRCLILLAAIFSWASKTDASLSIVITFLTMELLTNMFPPEIYELLDF